MELEIALPGGRWSYDPNDPLGPPGGFGEVFRGHTTTGDSVAVKRLKITAGEAAHRELRMADFLAGAALEHVLPVLDAGQDAESDSYFVVMPIAEMSLASMLEKQGIFEESDAVRILRSILAGLDEVPDIVHRDLKPDNVLLHRGQWKLADFGIARFTEESTSLNTLRHFLSPPYAAPEQWNLQEASAATDIYATACIGYALLTGAPPFPGPSPDDYRRQHLQESPPEIPNCSSRLRSILTMMLRKSPETRPQRARILTLLESLESGAESGSRRVGTSSLAAAGADVARKLAAAEAEAAREAEEMRRRRAIAQDAEVIFRELREEFFHSVLDAAPAAARPDDTRIQLDNAILQMQLRGPSEAYPPNLFQKSGWDVLLGGAIRVQQLRPPYVWSSSLWYARLARDDIYRWREVSYFSSPVSGRSPQFEPFAIDELELADLAASRIFGSYSIAFGPVCIDDEDVHAYIDRWSEIFSRALRGQLQHPPQLPLPTP